MNIRLSRGRLTLSILDLQRLPGLPLQGDLYDKQMNHITHDFFLGRQYTFVVPIGHQYNARTHMIFVD